MLFIRKEQMKIFDNAQKEQFVQKMIKHLLEIFPEEMKEKNDEEIRVEIQNGIKKASDHDITGEQGAALYIDLLIGMGLDFEKQKGHEWIESVLQRDNLTGQEKMDFVYARLQD